MAQRSVRLSEKSQSFDQFQSRPVSVLAGLSLDNLQISQSQQEEEVSNKMLLGCIVSSLIK